MWKSSAWMLPGSVGLSLLAVPAHAARLHQWHFDPEALWLEWVTDGATQPQVQVLSQPSRVVIDLPQTLWPAGRTVRHWSQGPIRQVRVAQFDATTTRLVVEWREAVRLQAADIRLVALGDGRWRLQLPGGEGLTTAATSSGQGAVIRGVRVVEGGILLLTQGQTGATRVQRSPDGQQVWIDLGHTALSPSYQPQPLPQLVQLGVQHIRLVQIAQQPPVTRVVLQVQPGQTQWQVQRQQIGYLGGILLVRGGDDPPVTATPDRWGVASPDPQPVAPLRPEMQPQSWALGSFPVENFQAYTSPFGPRGRGFHYGLDLAAPEGSYVRSWWDGRIVEIFNDPTCGTGIVIRSGRWEHIYCHLRGRAARDSQGVYLLDPRSGLNIRQGQWVTAGMRIGRVGMTGRTTGPHLHWGLRYDGRWIDPAVVLREMYAQQNRERWLSQQS